LRTFSTPLALLVFFPSAVPLFAQDTPVGPEGTQLATDQTPAAAVNTDALRNAAQNPIASLISVPIQENFNFNNSPGDRTQNVLKHSASDSTQRVEKLESDRPVDYSSHLSTAPGRAGIRSSQPKHRRLRIGRHESLVFLRAEEEQGDLGNRTELGIAYSNEHDFSWPGEIQPGALRGRARPTQAMDDWVSGKQRLVCRGSFQYRQTSRESIPLSVVRQLQHEKGLVSHDLANRHRQLESVQRQRLDGAVRRRSGKNHETRISAGEHHGPALCQSRSPSRNLAVGTAHAICFVVSQAHQGTGEGVVGAKTETDESGAASKVKFSSMRDWSVDKVCF
jgi:hypothetical protein